MIRNYLSIAFRNLRQNPLYSTINVSSLSIGLAACIIIYLFIRDERSFDTLHSKSESIYRLDEVQNFTGTNIQKVALSMSGMGPAMKEDFADVVHYTRYWNRGKLPIERDEKRFLIDNVVMVDSTFLDMFDFTLLEGDRSTALDEPNSILVTERTAKKFFKDGTAIGNSLKLLNGEFKITGILQNIPENSHMQFDALVSLSSYIREHPDFNDRWGNNFLNTYLLLQPNANIPALEKQFPGFLSRHVAGDPEVNDHYSLFLQKLSDVHLSSTDIEHDYNNYRKFNDKYLDVFTIVGIFILLIAAVNFMNLTTARSSHRWKEIGVRKTVGAKKSQLFFQFIFESLLLALLAIIFALLIDVLALPLVNELIGRKLSLMAVITNPFNVFAIITLTILLGLLTGIYPAFHMTSFNTARVMKGRAGGERRSVFRSSLVVIQFGLALAMIVSTFIVMQQLSFMQTKDIGFDKSQMLLIEMNLQANEKFETIKNELQKSTLINGVTAAGQRLGNNFHQWNFKVKYDTGVASIVPSNVYVDYDYLKVYGIRLKEGRDFNKEIASDNGLSFIVNESLAQELGVKNVIGTSFGHGWYPDDSLGTIIGVVEDFNFNSLHHKINTLTMEVHANWHDYDEMSIKIAGSNVQDAIAYVKEVWEKHVTNYPFAYTFLDDHFETLYRSDQQMSAVVTIMATLAILISCMGLFGLAAITTEKKIKEIGIRKALGATEAQITMILSRNFVYLIILSFVIVSPITWWILSQWLESFAYRVNVNPLLFLLGGAVALAIGLGTICYHTIRAARENPVNALRYE
jgi:putative ABC transport system permease protein